MRTVDAMHYFSRYKRCVEKLSLALSDNINVMRLENRSYTIARDIVTGVVVSQEGWERQVSGSVIILCYLTLL